MKGQSRSGRLSTAKSSARAPMCCAIAAFALALLEGCSWVAAGAQEAILAPTLRSGSETFTITAELPADFALRVLTGYSGDKSPSCQERNLETGKPMRRQFGKDLQIDFQDKPHTGSVRIPLRYSKGLCAMTLDSVDFYVEGRFGKEDWQQSYANGGLVLVRTLPAGTPDFQVDGTLSRYPECEWSFKLSSAKSRFGQIDKLLFCKGAGAYVIRDHLAGKRLRFVFRVASEETPYMHDFWLKTEAGWKPCTGRWGSKLEELCGVPPVFKTFEMNGRTCTTYPRCTE
ncbi:hypothetical protein [Pseudomonas schmalbachii]|uniref:Lipoprotein n=1 Tax=Pseudomonas schmalbachii TaxID=2816993 RepID=A0ABS3TM66_9PSED|nr:hypothetical protein [Pseudomonas schmalbachii]MBO3274761.1 hypothetical protein [Pseudomonas schmalbachii]